MDLAGWKAGDGDEADELVFGGGGSLLQPGAFGLILDAGYFANSTRYDPLPAAALILTVSDATLGNSGLSNSAPERVVLVSSSGDTVGAMVYTTGNRPGFSEEKIDPAGGDGPENWMDSRWEGGTPGRPNSVSPKDYDLALAMVSETPFPVPAGVSRDFVLAWKTVGAGRHRCFPLRSRESPVGAGISRAWDRRKSSGSKRQSESYPQDGTYTRPGSRSMPMRIRRTTS